MQTAKSETDYKEISCEAVVWIYVVQKRERWRTFRMWECAVSFH